MKFNPNRSNSEPHHPFFRNDDSASSFMPAEGNRMNRKVPSLFHFVYGLKPQTEPFHLIHYLCIASCIEINQPERVFLYYHYEPYGRYWDLIKKKLTLVRVSLDPFVSSFTYKDRGIKPYDYAHHSDFIRLERLLQCGGVYADIDTIFVNSIPEHLYEQSFVLGREPDITYQVTGKRIPSLCNAFIMSEKDACFGRLWLDHMKGAFDGSWSNHSTVLPRRLSSRYPELIHIEPQKTFYKHTWTRDDIQTLLQGCDRDVDGVVSMHLWAHLWWSKKRRDFSSFHAKRMTETFIRNVDTTYNLVARKYLPSSEKRKRLFFLPRWLTYHQAKGARPHDFE